MIMCIYIYFTSRDKLDHFLVSGKENCFGRVVTRFGRRCTYVVIGHDSDEENAARAHNFPFWRIEQLSDTHALYKALDMGFL